MKKGKIKGKLNLKIIYIIKLQKPKTKLSNTIM